MYVTNVLKTRERDGIYFFHADGKPYESVKKAFYAAQRRAGIKHCRFHDLRHHFATRLVLNVNCWTYMDTSPLMAEIQSFITNST
ncbi:MAG: tyrosine-type recombinase/integrase [Chlamydiota bacterium]